MNLPVEQFVAGTVTGIGVLALIVFKVLELRKEKKENGATHEWMENVKVSLESHGESLEVLKGTANKNHESIEVLRTTMKSLSENCGLHRESQDKVTAELKCHLAKLDQKVYDMAVGNNRK